MAHPLYVAFIWHQHQPLYKSQVGSSVKYRMPWVRLHGTKDYLDLILMLERYPNLHQTVNLVPSLILQLEDYVAGTALDPYLTAALTPSDRLTISDKEFIIQSFFDCNHHTMIDPHPRYGELYQQKQDKGSQWCLENWNLQDYEDLLAWHNLAWIDPLFWDDPEVESWLKQGRNFTLSDRQRIIAKHRQIISRIIPKHRQMQETGQLEITTTPYSHPILPLLADTDVGRVATPHIPLPHHRFQWSEDIPRHLQKSWDMYLDRFGTTPRGLWPSEQAVSPTILPYVAKQGFKWLCSDEAVLGWTLHQAFHRDGAGNLMEPEKLYRPYRLETPHGDLAMVFRDHRLSDLIGFSYSGMEPKRAAKDLVGHLEAISRQLKHRQPGGGHSLEQPWLVTIALDGENCWEYYQQDGKPFLEHLYQTLSQDPAIKLVTVSEFLDKFPPTATIYPEQLHTGSWVDGSLTTWIGDPAKNRAWDLLYKAREAVAAHPEATEASHPDVWEALYAAEGSDWFWWFGEGHSSNHDAVFDELFREHLKNIYQGLNLPIPAELKADVEVHAAKSDRRPESFIHPLIDGKGDEQDWDRAGRLDVGGARGTMHRSSAVQRLWYGVDHQNFYIRLDFQTGIQPGKDCPPELNLLWFYPDRTMHNSPAPLEKLPDEAPLNYMFHHHLEVNLVTESVQFQEAGEHWQWHPRLSRAQVALEKCLEIAVPWADLQIQPDYPIRMLLVLSDEGAYQDYLPENTLIPIEVP